MNIRNVLKKHKNNHGFTLVELIVTMAVFALVMVQVGAIVANCSKLYKKGISHVGLQSEAQRVIQLTEELMIDATESISANASATYPGSDDISIVTNTVDGGHYQYDIYLKKDNVSDETGKVYLKKTEIGGSTIADQVMAENIKSISCNMSNYASDDRVTVSVTMKSGEYEYDCVDIKDIYLRNQIGSGSGGGDDIDVNGNYTLDVRRYKSYDLRKMYGSDYVYEKATPKESNPGYDNFDLSDTGVISCTQSVCKDAGVKTSVLINAYKKGDITKTVAFTIACNTDKVRVGLCDEGSFDGTAICYYNNASSAVEFSYADVAGITLDDTVCDIKCEFKTNGDFSYSGDTGTFGPGIKKTAKLDGTNLKLENFYFEFDPQSEALRLTGSGNASDNSGKDYCANMKSKESFYALITATYKNPDVKLHIKVYFTPLCSSTKMIDKFYDFADEY